MIQHRASSIEHPVSIQHPVVLAIGGLDPSGGAGLPADARAIRAFGAHCCGVATAVIAQNTQGVAHVEPVSAEMLAAQLDNLLEDIAPRAVKIGMVPHADGIAVIAERLRAMQVPIIIDPVLAPSSGAAFMDEGTVEQLLRQLTPLAELVTPNIPEAMQLTGARIGNRMEMRAAVKFLHDRCGSRAALLKGGHLPSESAEEDPSQVSYDMVDVLYDGARVWELRGERMPGSEVRGTGCLLASAIAAQRAQDVPLLEAVRRAQAWLRHEICEAQIFGRGRRLVV